MRSWVPELKSCCYFVSLRTGAKICGLVAIVGSLILTMLSAINIAHLIQYIGIITEKFGSDEGIDQRIDFEPYAWKMGIYIALQMVHMATSCCLILGAYQERASLVSPWLVTCLLSAVAEVALIPLLSVRFVFEMEIPHVFSPEWALLTGIFLVDDIYGWLVVFSYYHSIKHRRATNSATSPAL